MKRLITVSIFLYPLICFSQFEDFNWLKGEWILEDRITQEIWKLDESKEFLKGVSFRFEGKDTTITEKIKIKFEKGVYYYVPDVAGNQQEVYFKITSHSNKGFVAENPEHDFPKVIRYELVSSEILKAQIEGDGKIIPYVFHRSRWIILPPESAGKK